MPAGPRVRRHPLTAGEDRKARIIDALREQGYPVLDMSDNEMAKLHVRYMVGGHAPGIRDELLYRFQFPERPGALLEVSDRHGARLEYQPVSLPQSRLRLRPGAGRGIQVPEADRPQVPIPLSVSWLSPSATRPTIPLTGCFWTGGA
jgi:hypothetical protein